MPRPKPKTRSITRSVEIPDDLWDTAGRQPEARAVTVRLALRDYFIKHGIPIEENE